MSKSTKKVKVEQEVVQEKVVNLTYTAESYGKMKGLSKRLETYFQKKFKNQVKTSTQWDEIFSQENF